MNRIAKILIISFAVGVLMLIGSGFIVAGTVASSGLVTVSVHESGPDGMDLFIPVPAGLVKVGLALTPVVLSMVDSHALDHELERYREELDLILPAVVEMLSVLETMPDATLVEVEGRDEYVKVTKEGRKIRVLVDEPDARVSISIPVSVFRSVGGFLAG
jgi:hypothetical protein